MGVGGQEVRALQGAVSNVQGTLFEQDVAASLGLGEVNSQVYTGMTSKGPVNTVPDFPVGPQYGVTEVKSSTSVVDTPQIRGEAAVAKQNDLPFNIVISPNTDSISGTVIGRVENSDGKVFQYNPDSDTWTTIDFPDSGPWRRE